MRVDQLLPVLAYGDAIGNDALAIRDVIRGMGIETEIYYSDHMDPRLPAGTAKPLSRMPERQRDDVLFYHACTDDPVVRKLPELGGKKAVIYHNVTPPEFFHAWNPEVERIQRNALEGFRFLADRTDYCVADSEFNQRDLLDMGFRCPIDVCPIVIPFDDYDAEPDRQVMERMRRDGTVNLLFVGRISPNKRQEDVIRAFYDYRRKYEPESRLVLIGSDAGMEKYSAALKRYARQLGLGDRVLFPGHIRFSEILAYYRTADVFVCMSEHEGFCVPLVEAMYFGVPVAAFRSTAVPDTLGKGGLLLESRDPAYVSAAIDRIVKDERLRKQLRKEQCAVLERFSHAETKRAVAACVEKAIQMRRTAD